MQKSQWAMRTVSGRTSPWIQPTESSFHCPQRRDLRSYQPFRAHSELPLGTLRILTILWRCQSPPACTPMELSLERLNAPDETLFDYSFKTLDAWESREYVGMVSSRFIHHGSSDSLFAAGWRLRACMIIVHLCQVIAHRTFLPYCSGQSHSR